MLRAMRALVMSSVLVGLLVACSHPPPPAPPAAQVPVATWEDVAGTWTAFDDLDFSYTLQLAPGDLLLAVNRGKLGTCNLHAKPILGAKSPKFELEVVVDECHRDRAAGPIHVAFPSFTGKQLSVEISDGAEVTTRTYARSVK